MIKTLLLFFHSSDFSPPIREYIDQYGSCLQIQKLLRSQFLFLKESFSFFPTIPLVFRKYNKSDQNNIVLLSSKACKQILSVTS